MATWAVYPDRDDLPEVPPVTALFVASVEWPWGPDRRDEYWLSRHDTGEWLLWISGEDHEGDASHIIYALTGDTFATPAEAAAHLLAAAWRTEGHPRFEFLVAAGLLSEVDLLRVAAAVWASG